MSGPVDDERDDGLPGAGAAEPDVPAAASPRAEADEVSPRPPRRWWTVIRTVVQFVLAVVVIVGGGSVALDLLRTAPKAQRRPPQRHATLVEVQAVRRSTERVRIDAPGTVLPSREIELRPRVSGDVVEVSAELVPGGRVGAGEAVVRVEPVDYELRVREAQAAVAQARAGLRIERGTESVARLEYELFGREVPATELDLVLREPQVARSRAALAAAQAKLDAANLDLERTAVVAPFDAVVRSYAAVVGMRVSEATTLATLAATDEWWVEVAVPVDELRWIRIPRDGGEEGAAVVVRDEAAWGEGEGRAGRVIRLAPDLEEHGRLARLIVAVSDPLALEPGNAGRPSLVLGAWVQAEIEGRELDDVVAIEARQLRDGRRVWVMDGEGRLDLRPVTVAYRERDRALISDGLADGDRIVTSEIGAPVQGMQLRLRDEEGRGGPRGGEGGAGPRPAEAGR